MKVLLTGANGFVARHLIEALRARGDATVGADLAPAPANPVDRYVACDLTDAAAVRALVEAERPDAIVHLAAVSSVGRSWEIPAATFTSNTTLFLNIVEAVRELKLPARVLSVGSSEEYGVVPAAEQPIPETRPVAPTSPYAVARVAQEQLSRLYADHYGLDVVMTRSFNQIGPGQRVNFVVPSFVKQLLDGRARGESTVKMSVGDLSVVRDFIDVRDASAAYLALLDRGVSGEIYNVCSGEGRALGEVLATAAKLVGVETEISVDPARLRPTDNPRIIGDNSKLRALGWSPTRSLRDTLASIIG